MTDPQPADACPHCRDGGHDDPRRKPWSVWVGTGDKPYLLEVAPSAGSHVAESDAEWLRELIRTHRSDSALPEETPDA
jgi:hypothetical protein